MRPGRLAVIGLILTAYYLLILDHIGFFSDPDYFLLSWAPDSAEYFERGRQLLGLDPAGLLDQRPYVYSRSFFYPLFIGLLFLVGGLRAIWVTQGVMWVVSGLLLWLSVSTLTKSRSIKLVTMMAYLASWTPIVLSTTILTEPLSLMLFTIIVWLTVGRPWGEGSWAAILVFLGLLVAVKPNYLVAATFAAAVIFVYLILRTNTSWRILAPLFVAMLLPTVLDRTWLRDPNPKAAGQRLMLQQSIYAQVVTDGRDEDLEVAIKRIENENPETAEMLGTLLEKPGVSLKYFFYNLEENIRTVLFTGEPSRPEKKLRKFVNGIFFWLHAVMALLTGFVLYKNRKSWNQADSQLTLLAGLFYLTVLPTGLSFWAADRWMAPLITLWPVLYISVWMKFRTLRKE